MNRFERQFAKRLDELEKGFVARYREYLDRVIFLPHAYNVIQATALQPAMQGTLAKLLTQHVHEVLAIGQAHGDILCRELHKKYAPYRLAGWQPSFQLAGPLQVDPEKFWLTPQDAIKALEAREILLAGDVEADILAGTKKILLNHLYGATRAETEKELTRLLDDNVNRARLITTTETTYAYNRGRLSSFQANDVDYVRFSAVMDARTSAQCRSRHGKVMRMDSPELAANTPPLHGRCRSVLSPIYSAYQPEMITPETTDWKEAVPLPKGWRTGENRGTLKSGDMNSLEQAKKRDHKIYITDTAIGKVPLVQVKSFTAQQNIGLQTAHKEILKVAQTQNDSNEVLGIYLRDFTQKATVFGGEYSVDPGNDPNAVAFIRAAKWRDLLYVHNHPSTKNFSLADIDTFVTRGKIQLMSVVTNQGEVYILHKNQKYDYNKVTSILTALVDKAKQYNKDQRFVVSEFFKVCDQGGIDYEKGK